MLGTIVNTSAIIIGGILGLLIKGGLSERFKSIVLQSVGLAVVFIGLSSSLPNLTNPDSNPVLFVISLVIGGVLGEWVNIEDKLESLGKYLEKKFQNQGSVSQGFVSASLLFCVGTMSVLGAIESGISGVHSILYAKSVLDGVTSIIFAASMGIGVLISALSVFLYQGTLTLLAGVIEPFITTDMLREVSAIGGILITGLGLNLLGITKLRVGNLLPSIIIPVVYYGLFF